MHIFRVSKWFKNHHIRYLSSFAAISVSDFKRRYPYQISSVKAKISESELQPRFSLWILYSRLSSKYIFKYLKNSEEFSFGISEWNLDQISTINLLKSSFILAKEKHIFKCLHKLGNWMKISRLACARAQHVILGMPVAMNTRKACCIGYFDL